MRISVVLPTYNEADNIERLILQLLALPQQVDVIVVDDASPDGTGRIADRFAADDPSRVHVLHRPGKLGLGTAHLAGYRRALETGRDGVLSMDADFSHDPRHIPDMVAMAGQGADVVIGSRYVPGGRAVNSPLRRRLLSRMANMVAKTFLGLKANDVTAGFRLYRAEVLRSIPLDTVFSSGYSFLTETLYLVQQRGWRVREVPIQFHDRVQGTSKISQREVYLAMLTVGRLSLRRLRGR